MESLNFRAIFAAAPGPYLIITADADHTILDVNEAYRAATLTTREQLIGTKLFDAFPDNPADPAATGVRNLRASLEHVMRHREPHRMAIQKYDIRRPDGTFEERHWSPLNTPIFGDDGETVSAIIHHVEDVTEFVQLKRSEVALGAHAKETDLRLQDSERRILEYTTLLAEYEERLRAEAALRDSAERLRAVFEQSSAGIAQLSLDGKFILANRFFCEMIGYPCEELMGKHLQEITHPDDIEAGTSLIQRAARTGEGYRIEKRYVRKDGSIIWVSLSGNVIRDAQGQPEAILGVATDISDSKKAEIDRQEMLARVKQQAKIFDTALTHINDFAYILDRDGRFRYVNKPLLDLWGLTLEQAVGKNFFELNYPQELASKLQSQIQEVIDTKKVLVDETAYTSPKGISGYYEYIFSPVVGADGTVEAIAGSTRVTTARKQLETVREQLLTALREGEAYLRAALDSSAGGFYGVDREGNTTVFNASFLRMLGFERADDAAGKKLHDVIHHSRPDGSHYPKEDCPIYLAACTGTPAHVENELFFRLDGTSFPVEYWTLPIIQDGEVRGAVTTFIDITERKRAQEALRTSELRFRSLFESMDEGFCVVEMIYDDAGRPSDYRFLEANPTFDRHTGFHDAVGRTIRELVPEHDAHWFEIYGAVAATGQSQRFVNEAKAMGRWYDVYAFRVGEDGSRRVGILFTDITARKRAEGERERLLESERAARSDAERASRMKDEFLATLSHELRTPLNAILGWSQILASGSRDEEDLGEGLRTIERNARAQTQIIEDLLDMSRIISGKVRLDVQRVDLAAVVQSAVESLRPAADAKGVRLQVVLDPLAGPVSGDPNRLQQVFWNLLTNAVKFTPKEGRVQVLLERVNSHLEVSFIDTGEGISPEFLPHVFDRFRQADATPTRRHGGLGLGLSIVKQLVELHGGSIRAKSAGTGQGATFTVALPLTVLQAEPDYPTERRHPTARTGPVNANACAQIEGIRVLVVDDEPDARALVKRLLEDCKAVVTVAASAAEAFESLLAAPPDVLVSDIGMPNEDGHSLIRRVRGLETERGGHIPAVALTAYARSEDRINAVMAGFQHHVAKPVEPAELITMIASLVRPRG